MFSHVFIGETPASATDFLKHYRSNMFALMDYDYKITNKYNVERFSTTFFINQDIDTGAIILQKEVPVSSRETAGELHDRLMEVGSDLVVETVRLIEKGNYELREQPAHELKPAPKLNKENCRIDWEKPLKKIYDHIRGLSPYPSAWTLLEQGDKQVECKIYGSGMIEEKHSLEPGSILADKKEIRVAAPGGFLKIEVLQLSGKRKMDAASFLNGFHFKEGDRFI